MPFRQWRKWNVHIKISFEVSISLRTFRPRFQGLGFSRVKFLRPKKQKRKKRRGTNGRRARQRQEERETEFEGAGHERSDGENEVSEDDVNG